MNQPCPSSPRQLEKNKNGGHMFKPVCYKTILFSKFAQLLSKQLTYIGHTSAV